MVELNVLTCVCVWDIYIHISYVSYLIFWIYENIYINIHISYLCIFICHMFIYIYVFIISSVFNSSKFFCTDWTDDVVVCAAELGYVILLWLRDAFYLFILYIMVFGYPHTSHWIIFIWVEMGYNVEFFQLTSLY